MQNNMKKTLAKIRVVMEHSSQVRDQTKDAVEGCLAHIGQPVEFDWKNGAPRYVSYHLGDKPVDWYVTKIGYSKTKDDIDWLTVNLHNAHTGEELEDVVVGDSDCIDWGSILACLIPRIGEGPVAVYSFGLESTKRLLTADDMQTLVNQFAAIQPKMKNAVKEALVQLGKPLEFVNPDNYIPCYEFYNLGDKEMFSYDIKKLWLDEAGNIAVNLDDWYNEKEIENVVPADSDWIYWWDILWALKGEFD